MGTTWEKVTATATAMPTTAAMAAACSGLAEKQCPEMRCTHAHIHAHMPATWRRHVFAFYSSSHSLSFAVRRTYVCMHLCALHCESAVRQSGLASGFEFRLQYGSSTFRVAYYCGNFMPFAPPGNPCKLPSTHATTSCPRAKLAR